MRQIMIVAVLAFTIILTGCEDPSLDFIVHSNANSNQQNQQNTQPNQPTSPANSKNNLNIQSEPECGLHEFWNQQKVRCDCVDGFVMTSNGCIPEKQQECVFDKDCGVPVCASAASKLVPRCDIRTYKCLEPEFVSCKDYGPNYVCKNGNCVN